MHKGRIKSQQQLFIAALLFYRLAETIWRRPFRFLLHYRGYTFFRSQPRYMIYRTPRLSVEATERGLKTYPLDSAQSFVSGRASTMSRFISLLRPRERGKNMIKHSYTLSQKRRFCSTVVPRIDGPGKRARTER